EGGERGERVRRAAGAGEADPGGEAPGTSGERRTERPAVLPGDEPCAERGALRSPGAVPAELVEDGVARASLGEPEGGAEPEEDAGGGGEAGEATAEEVGGERRAGDPEGEGERQPLAGRGVCRDLDEDGQEGDEEGAGEVGPAPAPGEGEPREGYQEEGE